MVVLSQLPDEYFEVGLYHDVENLPIPDSRNLLTISVNVGKALKNLDNRFHIIPTRKVACGGSHIWRYKNVPKTPSSSGSSSGSGKKGKLPALGNLKSLPPRKSIGIPDKAAKLKYDGWKVISFRKRYMECTQCGGFISGGDSFPYQRSRNVADFFLLSEILAHVVEHPSPGTIVIASGDKDFGEMVDVLKDLGYLVIIAADREDTYAKSYFHKGHEHVSRAYLAKGDFALEWDCLNEGRLVRLL